MVEKIELSKETEIENARVELMRRQKIVQNRLSFLGNPTTSGLTHDGRRDTWEIFGWPQQLSYSDFLTQYRRGVGGRIINLPAEDTWKKPPQISEDGDVETPFVLATNQIIKNTNLWKRLIQGDKLSGIGQFAVILIGVKDLEEGGEVAEVLELPVNGKSVNSVNDIIFLKPYSQESVTQIELDSDPTSPRFGLPEFYSVQANAINTVTSTSISTTVITDTGLTQSFRVHWTRVLHIVRDPITNDVLGEPTLERPYNTISGIYTSMGATVEAYWQIVWGGLVFVTKEGYKLDPDDKEELEIEIDEYQNQWRRYMRLKGVDIEKISSENVEPGELMASLTLLLAGESGIPLRILFGSERGELASSQDERNWAGKISSRQTSFAEPLLRDFIDRLIIFGVVPPPGSGSYDVGNKDEGGNFEWPSIFEQSEGEKAITSKERSMALRQAQDAKMLGANVSNNEIRNYGGLPALPNEDFDKEMELPDELLAEALKDIGDLGAGESENDSRI